MKVIAGLGNPERKYEHTKHNTGFEVIDILSDKWGINADAKKHRSLEGRGTVENEKVILLKPQTYMNNSGEAVREAAQFYKIAPDHIIVISDDVSLDVGKQRIKRKGSDGGQKGLKSIIYHLQSDAFPRVKIGVGKKPHPEYNLADWVLGDIPQSEWPQFEDSLKNGREAIDLILQGKIDAAMNQFNS